MPRWRWSTWTGCWPRHSVVTALTFLARDGAAGALHPLAAGPFPGSAAGRPACCARLGAGSRQAARLQDQYGLRAAPQTLGIAVDGAATLREVVTALAAAGLENPMVMSGRPHRWCITAGSTLCI